jgi:multiple antibiotic resistance protein
VTSDKPNVSFDRLRTFSQKSRGNPYRRPARSLTKAKPLRARRPIEIFRETIVLTIGALLPIMNPFSTAPLFMALTAGMNRERRNRQAFLACIYAFGILITFLLLGSAIIDFFRISIPGLRTAGGLIMSAIGFKMLFSAPPAVSSSSQIKPKQELEVAFTPLAMPSLAGPGSITVVLTAAPQIKRLHPDDRGAVVVAVILGMIVTLVLCLLVLRAASSMVRFLGQSGIDAMTRIFGFLIICIGMQFLLTGIGDFFNLQPV